MQKVSTKHGEGLIVLLIYILCFSALIQPTIVNSASLRLISEGITKDNLLKLSLYAETSQISPFNAVSALISYPEEQIDIVSMDVNDSILSLWPEEPESSSGIISLSGGTYAKGGFIFKGKVLDIYARFLEGGSGSINIEDAEILASDGVGTNILSFKQDYEYARTLAIPQSFDLNKNGSVSITELSISLIK